MVLEFIQFGFMQRALIAGISVSILCSVVGLFLVLRRQSLFGDALSHMAFGGVALGLFTNTYPVWTALAISVLGAVGITKLREIAKIPADSAIAILLSSGLALGIVLISVSNGFNVDLFSFLFGSILLVSVEDTLLILSITGVIISIMIIFYKKFLYITFDEEQAKVSGLNISRLNYLFVILASIMVIASMRLVGIMLISSLIVIPNITAIMLGKGFKKTAIASISISVASSTIGIIISYVFDLATSGTVVLVLVAIFLLTLGVMHFKKSISLAGLALK